MFTAVGYGAALLRRLLVESSWRDGWTLDHRRAHLIWTSRKGDLTNLWEQLASWQLVNHFPYSIALGSKAALLTNLRTHCCQRHVAPLHELLPRSYDLQRPSELRAFLADFALTRAEGFLRAACRDMEGDSACGDVAAAARLLRHAVNLGPQGGSSRSAIAAAPSAAAFFLAPEASQLLFGTLHSGGVGEDQSSRSTGLGLSEGAADVPPLVSRGEAERLLAVLEMWPQRQACLGGTHGLWLLKEPHLNCGKGVQVHQDLLHLLREARQYNWRCVVQKYVENSLLVSLGRKCDIRVWVLVTSWSPAVVWIHPEPYFRLASRPHSFDPATISDPFVHLTNRSVQKEGGGEEQASENKDEGHILMLEAFFAWAAEGMPEVTYSTVRGGFTQGSAREAWAQCTWPRVVAAVRTAVLACQQSVGAHPPGCFELFGFDFLLDKQMGPWILEANSSPDLCEDAGPTLKKLIEGSLGELLSLVTGLQSGAVSLPHADAEAPWSRCEALAGSGKWQLCLREAAQRRPNVVDASEKVARNTSPAAVRAALRCRPSVPASCSEASGSGQAPNCKETHDQVLRTCAGASAQPSLARFLEDLLFKQPSKQPLQRSPSRVRGRELSPAMLRDRGLDGRTRLCDDSSFAAADAAAERSPRSLCSRPPFPGRLPKDPDPPQGRGRAQCSASPSTWGAGIAVVAATSTGARSSYPAGSLQVGSARHKLDPLAMPRVTCGLQVLGASLPLPPRR